MSTIHIPYRPPGYLARQGYVKPLWEVVLRRSDTRRKYFPDDEAYNLPALKDKLESDKYSVSTIDRLTLELPRPGDDRQRRRDGRGLGRRRPHRPAGRVG